MEAFFRGDYLGNYYESGVPSTLGGTRAVLPFDFTTFAPTGARIMTGFAIANLDRTTTATVVCTARDDLGVEVLNAVPLPALKPFGHYAHYQFYLLKGKRGTMDCTSNTRIGVLGLRVLGTRIASLPVIYK